MFTNSIKLTIFLCHLVWLWYLTFFKIQYLHFLLFRDADSVIMSYVYSIILLDVLVE
jgi:hypothetical protein